MAVATTTLIAAASLAVGVGGAYMSYRQQRAASRAQQEALDQQKLIQGEQQAANAEASAAERRQQVREARIRRAQILQSAANTGTAQSSGEFGALSSISTQLNTNMGSNSSQINRANRVSGISQNIANLQSSAAQSSMNAGVFNTLSNLGSSIFSSAGGWNTFKTRSDSFQPISPMYRLN